MLLLSIFQLTIQKYRTLSIKYLVAYKCFYHQRTVLSANAPAYWVAPSSLACLSLEQLILSTQQAVCVSDTSVRHRKSSFTRRHTMPP
jgi:hypothetical protein